MKLCAFGELLIDVAPYGVSDRNFPIYEFNPGGAPANVAVAVRNLGQESSFIGQVGHDHFGLFLKQTLNEKKVDTEGLLLNKHYPTSLAIVSIGHNGERSFSFYRKNNADVMVEMNDLFKRKVDEADIFHIGSVSMTDEPCRQTSFDLLRYAKDNNKVISYDPNLRRLLWDDLEVARELILKGFEYADIIKVSEEELEFLTGINDYEKACAQLSQKYPFSLLFVTFGSNGCAYYYQGNYKHIASYKVNAIDTTGAGDGFFGGVLVKLMDNKLNLDNLSEHELTQICVFANACGAHATTQKGAIGSLAFPKDIENYLGKMHE
jgi:fructokinase